MGGLAGVVAVVVLGAGAQVHADDAVRTAVADAIARRFAGAQVVVDGITLDGPRLAAVYGARAFAPLWSDERAAAVTRVVEAAGADGLDPAAYQGAALAAHAVAQTPDEIAARDLLVTGAVLAWVIDMHRGVAPPRPSDEAAVEPRAIDAVASTIAAAEAPDTAAYLGSLAPRHPGYARLRAALAAHRALAAAGGWPAVPDGPSLRPGDADPVIAIVRQRLAVTGELAVANDAPLYDAELETAVRAFQRRHGLEPDGVVGHATRVALGTTVDQRIEQIVANMERWRWLPDELGPRHVRVNIPGYALEMVDSGRTVLEMPVVVGSTTRRTPQLSSRITTLVFNPTWTVPVKLARQDMLPKVRRDQQYFANQGIRIYASWSPDAGEVHPDEIDWQAIGADIGGLKLRQEPGPGNPLGRVKFVMPNGFDVYLHDTNAKGLMQRARRAQSSGCVRLGDALALADLLLDGQVGWTPERRAAVTADWTTRTVSLGRPLPVHLVYETAWIGPDGTMQFREDVYGRDRALVNAMTAALRRRRGGSET
jgi:murein L,D-transpeptidase YcbB/YkuD